MYNYISGEQVETSIIEKFVEQITHGKKEHFKRFCEIFSARGFLLDLDGSSGKVRLSDDSHAEDGEFLEMLQNSNYKKICNKPHQDSLIKHNTESTVQNRHPYFEN
ncbi:MAG: hypothetical protein Q7J76_00010, partial [Candidatus Brocadiaceae bacterium]|nr:hypothetical protein [Candidatus Brocadiaceae bacterium]